MDKRITFNNIVRATGGAASVDAGDAGQRRLLEAIRGGDPMAFGEYYYKYFDPMVRFLIKILGNEEEAKEVAQDVFAGLWENRSRIDPERSVYSMIFGTGKNMAYNILRRRLVQSKYVGEAAFTHDGLEQPAEERMITDQTIARLEQAIESLPPQQRKVYRAYRIEGRPLREIAEEMGISYETARGYVKTASKIIKQALAAIVLALFIH